MHGRRIYTCLRCLSQQHGQATRSTSYPKHFQNVSTLASRATRNVGPTRRHRPSAQADVRTKALPVVAKRAAASVSVEKPSYQKPILGPNDLFHPLSTSPMPDMRRRGQYMRQHAYCPHPEHRRTKVPYGPLDPEHRKPIAGGLAPAHVSFECPDCGIPVSCSQEHWADDYESHLEICDQLREVNEDDHDLRSGRHFGEFHYPGWPIEEAMPNLSNWDALLYTREFRAINAERPMRQATKLLTYPFTIGSVLHELSPYNIRTGGRLTPEGLKSLSALRYTLHPPRDGSGGAPWVNMKLMNPPVRIFILGARAESSLPREAWLQLLYLFPFARFHLIFIGPESMTNRDGEFPLPERTPSNPFGGVIEDPITHKMKFTTYVEYYHTMHEAQYFHPYDPYFDCFMLFHPGLGHPTSLHEWKDTIPQLLETKVPIFVTGYSPYDMERDVEFVKETCAGEMDMLMEPGENIFRSWRWDINDLDPQDLSCSNWGVWAFRGKRYETTAQDA